MIYISDRLSVSTLHQTMSNLVIVESPAKCSKIQGYLGSDFRVIATMGHIRALEESLDAIGITRDFEPRYALMATKAKALKQIKDSASKATTIYLASDDDREGEAIAYSVCVYLRLNPATTHRIVFHEITKQAIQTAVANPRRIDMNRVHAQQARSMLDMMIGFTMSPLLWTHVARGLSAGRCQTPALRLVVERETGIQTFSAESAWNIKGTWLHQFASASLNQIQIQGSMIDSLEDEESACNYLEIVQDPKSAIVTKNQVKPWSSSAPQPLITSTLQQQASALYSIPPKATMQSAQRLYESGHITYMRTDTPVVSTEAQMAIREYITTTYGSEYVGTLAPATKTTAKTKAKGGAGGPSSSPPSAQEAHECIRPTHIEISPTDLPGEWSASDSKIYTLIWQRAIQSQMASARGETCTVQYMADAEGASELPWESQWKRTLFPGWQAVGKVADLDDEQQTANSHTSDTDQTSLWTYVTRDLLPGSKLQWQELVAEPHETRAQPRYTEATLVRELEKHGIGRPSTFASLIATIQDKGYVELRNIPGRQVTLQKYVMTVADPIPRPISIQKTIGAERQKLVPTDLGRSALQFMLHHFNDLFAYTFTGAMEQRLDRISDGEEPWKAVLRDMWDSYKDRYETLSANRPSSTSTTTTASPKLREFSNHLKAVMSKKGPLILYEPPTKGENAIFYGWPPSNVAFHDITEEQVLEFVESKRKEDAPIGEWNGHPIVKKTGKFGPYVKAGDRTVSILATDTLEEICAKLEAKHDTTLLKSFKTYEIHNGQYGPYIIKTDVKIRKFVSVPPSITIDTLSEADVTALYKAGLETKSKKRPPRHPHKKN
jgi:DNA topoisomerase-1